MINIILNVEKLDDFSGKIRNKTKMLFLTHILHAEVLTTVKRQVKGIKFT